MFDKRNKLSGFAAPAILILVLKTALAAPHLLNLKLSAGQDLSEKESLVPSTLGNAAGYAHGNLDVFQDDSLEESLVEELISIRSQQAYALHDQCDLGGKRVDSGVYSLSGEEPYIHNCLSQAGNFCQVCKFSYATDDSGRHCMLKSNGKIRFPDGQYLSPHSTGLSDEPVQRVSPDMHELLFVESAGQFKIISSDFSQILTVEGGRLHWKNLFRFGHGPSTDFTLKYNECGGFVMQHVASQVFVDGPNRVSFGPACLEVVYI